MRFNFKKSATNQQNVALSNDELLALRQFANQLNCASVPQQKLDSHHVGSLPTSVLGSGIDYAESRIYQPGNDIRSINWRLSARSQEIFVKTYHIESRPSLGVLLDRRRSMIFGTRVRLKITQAIRVASVLAYAAEQHNLAFQGWILDDGFGDGLDEGKGLLFFDDIDTFISVANRPVKISASKIKMESGLDDIRQKITKGSLLYLISDFSDLDNANRAMLAGLSEKAYLQAIHIQDSAELDLPKFGKLSLQDMQQDRCFTLDTQHDADLQVFTDYATHFLEEKRALFKALGITRLDVLTDVDDFYTRLELPLGHA